MEFSATAMATMVSVITLVLTGHTLTPVKEAMSRYFSIFLKSISVLHQLNSKSNALALLLKTISYGTETVSCHLLLPMARMEVD